MVANALLEQLGRIVGDDRVVSDPIERMVYESDGFPIARAVPHAVVFPASTEQVSQCVRSIVAAGHSVVPRGSGTGLTGGCVGYDQGVVICTSRMTRIIDIDVAGRTACVEAGVLNQALSEAVARQGGGERLHFAPDPSRQRAATVAGNVATNAGGLHTLKYGVTARHVLGVEMVLADGSVVTTGEGLCDTAGPNVTGLACGSEGTLGLLTRVWVRLAPRPHAWRTVVGVFAETRAATQTVTDVIASGIVPAAMELMDGRMVQVVEEAFGYGFPADAGALLLIEVDGVEAVLDHQMHQLSAVCRRNGATDVEASSDPVRRRRLWAARKRAFGAIGRISPSYCTQDACVPRSMLSDVVERIGRIGEQFGLTITNVFHAGDGNVHPILLFDEDDPEQVRNVMHASHEILRYCISIGGAVTGEHGVGVEKLPLMAEMFSRPTLELFAAIKRAADPHGRMNPGKLLPSDRVRVDLTAPPASRTPGGAMA